MTEPASNHLPFGLGDNLRAVPKIAETRRNDFGHANTHAFGILLTAAASIATNRATIDAGLGGFRVELDDCDGTLLERGHVTRVCVSSCDLDINLTLNDGCKCSLSHLR